MNAARTKARHAKPTVWETAWKPAWVALWQRIAGRNA